MTTASYPAVTYRGQPVSDGIAAGELYLADAPGVDAPGTAGTAKARGTAVTAGDVRAAFAAAAAERAELAAGLRADGREHDAGIVEIGALIAADEALIAPAIEGMTTAEAGMPTAVAGVPLAVATRAVRDAAEAQARILEALPDPGLAQRAGDVRQVAMAVIARLTGTRAASPPSGRPFILVSREADPADLIRLAGTGLAGAVSVGGGGSSHAAIIARGLGLPMLAGTDPAVLSAPSGQQALLDAVAGGLTVHPSRADLDRAGLPVPAGSTVLAGGTAPGESTASAGSEALAAGSATAPRPLLTADGECVTLLCNVASAAETRLGLSGGADGVGLLRTEIPFTQARGWPSRDDHLATLRPVLSLLAGRRAVVRLLDFAGDKVPPFPGAAGLTAFLQARHALADQLDAVLEAGRDTDLAIMIPMVTALEEVRTVRAELARATKAAGTGPPPLGIMVEVASTAANAGRFAREVDFFSIGTNDLTADVLGRDRSGLRPADAASPAVLRLIGHVTAAAGQAGIGVSVCGDAAADPAVLPLLIGLGVRTLSVGAARVPLVADWIAALNATEAAAQAGDL
jgi:phosphoenolpyruvate-protein kinase (PTS system EI component)